MVLTDTSTEPFKNSTVKGNSVPLTFGYRDMNLDLQFANDLYHQQTPSQNFSHL